jgi:hypothetical protein
MSRAQLRSRIKLAFEVVLVPDHLGGDDNRVDGDPDLDHMWMAIQI